MRKVIFPCTVGGKKKCPPIVLAVVRFRNAMPSVQFQKQHVASSKVKLHCTRGVNVMEILKHYFLQAIVARRVIETDGFQSDVLQRKVIGILIHRSGEFQSLSVLLHQRRIVFGGHKIPPTVMLRDGFAKVTHLPLVHAQDTELPGIVSSPILQDSNAWCKGAVGKVLCGLVDLPFERGEQAVLVELLEFPSLLKAIFLGRIPAVVLVEHEINIVAQRVVVYQAAVIHAIVPRNEYRGAGRIKACHVERIALRSGKKTIPYGREPRIGKQNVPPRLAEQVKRRDTDALSVFPKVVLIVVVEGSPVRDGVILIIKQVEPPGRT
mmetsp:Transcript_26232/g.73339  ORF Transcript_26232/g.73339 Transcript_26232/m.73339 type:complete len:322 (-) Transcript_26232:246-1211(-)